MAKDIIGMIKLRIVKWEDNPELGFSGGSVVKNLPAKQEMWVQSLGQEDRLEKEMSIHSSILARIIPRTGICLGLQRVRHN